MMKTKFRQAWAIPKLFSLSGLVSLSLGVATYVGQFQNASQLIKSADDALYVAKSNGRNRVEFSQ